jgi:hypothetical protein
MVWDKTAHWSRKLAEWLLAIVLAKFTIAAAFALAAATITHAAGEAAGLSAVLAGCAVLLLAGLTPWALLRLLPFVEAAAGHSLSPHNVRGAATSIPGATSATFAARQLAFQNLVAMRGPRSGGGAMSASPTAATAASGGAPTAPTELPQMPERRPAPRNTETPR